ncbi:nitrate- and nitrite sensing domain-containing protein [Streptomyces sp. NPDC088354]|uniref:sensor histidine kinase n=1 Tax=Streptomyces sp. NPDC088354 TaxID=3365856 RepID=UPI003819E8F8
MTVRKARRRPRSISRALPRPLPGWRTVRGRVAVVLAVPTCLLLAFVGLAVELRAEDYSDARTTRSEIELSLRLRSLVHQLQLERGLTNGLLGGETRYGRQLTATRELVDVQLHDLRDQPAVEDVIQTRLGRLAGTRADVDSDIAGRDATITFYTYAVTGLNAVDPAAGTATRGDRQLRDGVAALEALAQAKEALANERSSLNGVFAYGAFRRAEYLEFIQERAERLAAIRRFRQVATPDQRLLLDQAFGTTAANDTFTYEQLAERGVDGSRLNVDSRAWWKGTGILNDALYSVQRQVGADVTSRTRTLSDEAAASLTLYAVMGVLILGIVSAAAALASRSITRPLAALAGAADDIARRRLPEAVLRIQQARSTGASPPEPAEPAGVLVRHGAAEIAEVATALGNVERTALDLAAEQARLRANTTESLANLGRRNQGLIRRQLGLITKLESRELDPDELAELFELDHLATRMRRNAESLLVLTGQHTARPVARPATALEAVRSAVAQVEQYRRVMVAQVEPGSLRGHVVTDVAHLLAELIENGLTFSPPEESVDVHGWRDEAAGDYCFAVVDHGVGMSAADLQRFNALLVDSGDEIFLSAPTRFLGHHVVGRLARRQNIEVRLFDTPEGGVSALVVLPPGLLAPDEQEPPPPAPKPGISVLLNAFRAGVARAETGSPSAPAYAAAPRPAPYRTPEGTPS